MYDATGPETKNFTSYWLFLQNEQEKRPPSSRMISLHISTHSLQTNTDGPAMSFVTLSWLFPQKEQWRSLSPLSSLLFAFISRRSKHPYQLIQDAFERGPVTSVIHKNKPKCDERDAPVGHPSEYWQYCSQCCFHDLWSRITPLWTIGWIIWLRS